MEETASTSNESVDENYDVFDNILNFTAKDADRPSSGHHANHQDSHPRDRFASPTLRNETSCSGNEYSYSLPSSKFANPASPLGKNFHSKNESQPPSVLPSKRTITTLPTPQVQQVSRKKSGQLEGILVRKDAEDGAELDTSTELYENPFIARKPILGFTERIQKKPPVHEVPPPLEQQRVATKGGSGGGGSRRTSGAILPENATTPMDSNHQKKADGSTMAASRNRKLSSSREAVEAAPPLPSSAVMTAASSDDIITPTAHTPLRRANAFHKPLIRYNEEQQQQQDALLGNGPRSALTEAALAELPDVRVDSESVGSTHRSPRRLQAREEETSRPGSRRSNRLTRAFRSGSVGSNNSSSSKHRSSRRGSEGRSSPTGSLRGGGDGLFQQLKKKAKGKKEYKVN